MLLKLSATPLSRRWPKVTMKIKGVNKRDFSMSRIPVAGFRSLSTGSCRQDRRCRGDVDGARPVAASAHNVEHLARHLKRDASFRVVIVSVISERELYNRYMLERRKLFFFAFDMMMSSTAIP